LKEPNYTETADKLKIRIRAHTAYANFTLDDWLLDWLGEANGRRVLEVGCGNGNFFGTYAQALGKNGTIIGLDISLDLLKRARALAESLSTPTFLLHWDFDVHPYPLLDEDVDLLIAPFSAYYSNDVSGWIEDNLRLLKKKARLLLLGPTKDNAQELYELNKAVTGIGSLPETDQTSRKLEELFLPSLQERLGDKVQTTILDRQITFPSPEEFTRYYFATWLYEQTRKRIDTAIEFQSVLEAAKKTSLRLNKRIVCVEARMR
jgi:ubiquinone/menaquinone biosynthesis C-methylase UbiE